VIEIVESTLELGSGVCHSPSPHSNGSMRSSQS
jgi:hypothetical protein